MAPMKQQPIPDDSFSEAEAMKIVRGLSVAGSSRPNHLPGPPSARAILARTMEDEVIPRLLAARRMPAPAPSQSSAAQTSPSLPAPLLPAHAGHEPQPGDEHVAELVRLVLKGTQAQTAAYVEALHGRGLGADVLLLDLLTRTARTLGVMWEDDICDFTEVTMGVLRLNNLVRLICAAYDTQIEPSPSAPRALLVQAPGESHGLGLAMVVHFFRRAGWHVQSEAVLTCNDLVRLVSATWFGLVGISVSCNDRMDALAANIATLRRASRNPRLGVMVGGPPFIQHPQLVQMVGADSTASDAKLAVQNAHILVSRLALER